MNPVSPWQHSNPFLTLHVDLFDNSIFSSSNCSSVFHNYFSSLLNFKLLLPKVALARSCNKMRGISVLSFFLLVGTAFAFSVLPRPYAIGQSISPTANVRDHFTADTRLHMSDRERSRTTKKGVTTIEKDKVESQVEEQKKKEEMWRVVLHNDEVHTFNYVIRSLCKVIGTLDRKASFEICVQTHGIGKATVTKTWKKQAEQFCLGLQRQGLTVSISPDKDFDGGHSGGGL